MEPGGRPRLPPRGLLEPLGPYGLHETNQGGGGGVRSRALGTPHCPGTSWWQLSEDRPAPQGPWEACGRRPQPFSHVPIPHVVTTDMLRGNAFNPPEVPPPVLKGVRPVAGGRDGGQDSSPGTDPRATSRSLEHLATC